MNSKLIIAAVACLGLAACQPSDSDSKKEENKAPAEHVQGTEQGAEHPAPAQPAPATPGTSYYETEQSQQVAEQAPATDAQQDAANAAPAAEGEALQVSQQAEPQEMAQ